MPTPGENESQKDFVSRCIPLVLEDGTAKDQKQAAAVCYSMWEEDKKEADVSEKKRVLADLLADSAILQKVRDALGLEKATPMKTEGGEKRPAGDYLVIEDPQKPSTWHLPVKKNGTPDHRLMAAAKAALTSAGGFRGNRYEGPGKQEALRKLKRLYASEDMEWDTKESPHPFMVFKDKATEQYRWLAVYSNKFRDEDNPPEIIASTAHQEFVKAVDSGEWPMPELWLWHVGGTRSGAADWVAYDDNGFALASGTFDEGKEHIAKSLAEMVDLGTSHGMPASQVQRDTEDPTIITRYRSREISPLPAWAAANKHATGFRVVKEETMAVPENKRPFLEQVMGEEGVANLERQLEETEKELAGKVESKEAEDTEAEELQEQETEEAQETQEPEEDKEAPVAEEPVYVTASEVAEAVGAFLKPLVDDVAALKAELAGMTKELKSLQREDEQKVKDVLTLTPAHSLTSLIGSVIGADETAVDGRTSLAKSGPTETLATDGQRGQTHVPFINELMAAQRGHGG